jgi:hypothetical protein
MKQGRALPDLASELERQACAKRDYLAFAGDLSVRSNGHTDLLIGDAFPVTDMAHGQMAEYLEVPKAFYDRLRGNTQELVVRDDGGDPAPETSRALFDVIVNSLLVSKGPQKRLVRTLDGNARAFLSDSYSVDLDNFDVFRMAARAIEQAGLGPDNVVSAEVTERRLYLKVVSPMLEAEITPHGLKNAHGMLKEPQVVQAGFVLTNSETGLGSLRISQMVYKLVCTNGWIREEAYRQRHAGRALEADEDGTVFRSDTRIADAKARLLKVRDHISDALDEASFRDLVGKMQETACIRLEGGADKCVEATARKFGLTQTEKETVLGELIEGADLSLWGLTNAVTAAAQRSESYDRGTELEAIGGRFFSLTRPEIRDIVSAK